MSADISSYLSKITSEHNQQPNYVAAVSITFQALADIQALIESIPSVFDIDTAVGKQLDIVGQWAGVSRYLNTPLQGVYFSFDMPGVGWDQGVWKGQFDSSIGISILQDDHYRLLIKAKIVANHWDGTIPGAYAAWNTLFSPEGYTIIIQDGAPPSSPYFTFDSANVNTGWDAGSFILNDSIYNYSGGMNMVMGLFAPYAAPPPGLVYFAFDDSSAGWDTGYIDITPEPIAIPNIDAVTLALFEGGYLGLKPAGVHVDYATQSMRGLPMFAFDVGPSIPSSAPPVFLAGWDIGAWADITPGP